MTKGDIVVGLDIGTSTVRAIIGELDGLNVNIIGVGTAKSDGIKKGAIVDIDKTVTAIREAVDHAERMVGISIGSAYVGVSGNHISLQPSHGIVAVSAIDREIGDEDVERVIAAARVINLPAEREIVDVVPREFTVDGLSEVTDPRGMIGVRLEVDTYVVTGSRTVLHNLLRCVERADIEVAGTVLMPLAAAGMVLSADEKKLGVVLVDVGAGATTISVFERGTLERFAVVPVGGDSVTNDITVGLQTGTDAAEVIKRRYGVAQISAAREEEKFKVPRIGNSVEKEFSAVDLAYIIEPRMQEIFSLVRDEVERMGYPNGLPSGYVLSGGSMLLKGADKLAELELEAPVRIAIPDYVGVRDPSYVGCVGMIKYVSRYYHRQVAAAASSVKRQRSGGALQKIKGWFQDFI
ncbi:cell division protein FtsA [Sulfoacidibacillus thermotolerans]|uniref:Cell division protein FtsA n=1 Tax=Sulfoacidibacillus thermotolerans TaxID=1765684 RepID=A0A2U3D8V3_SULT2|nr:cell division protein FtsA [Sulfoacidibacillus thermotolerans]PWI57697.1 cell division protein FtsA [Sulfoacidibacillus thermotolerans]